MNDFGLLVGRYLSSLPSLSNQHLSELQLDASGRLIIAGRFLEDSSSTNGDPGIFILGIRNDSDSSLVDTDGDYAPFQIDENGRLKVVADIEIANSHEKEEDTQHSSGDIGSYILSVRADSRPTNANTSTDGDYASLFVNVNGELYTHDTDVLAKLTEVDTDISDLKQQEDELHLSGDYGIMSLAVQKATDGVLAGDGDYAPFQVDDLGFLKTSQTIGSEAYSVTDALAAAGDGLETITAIATPWVTVASLAVGSGISAYLYGWDWGCDQNAQSRIVTDDTTDIIVYKTSLNSSAKPSYESHWSESGRIEIPGATDLEIKLQIKKRSATGGDAHGHGNMHIRTL